MLCLFPHIREVGTNLLELPSELRERIAASSLSRLKDYDLCEDPGLDCWELHVAKPLGPDLPNARKG